MQKLTKRGVRIEFVKENLTFTGEDSPLANLMLSVMGAFAEFERALIRERQREGIALAKQRGAYRRCDQPGVDKNGGILPRLYLRQTPNRMNLSTLEGLVSRSRGHLTKRKKCTLREIWGPQEGV